MAGIITPIVMPKWGLSMKEGTVTAWLVDEGDDISVGLPILEVETDKIANAVEAPDPGTLRRKVAGEGELLPVKALLGVMADADVSDADIDAYIASYVTPSAEEAEGDAGPAYAWVEVDGHRIRYARRGAAEGTPVLFIHGFGGDLDNWLFNIDAVGEDLPVIALDLPGHGQSSVKLPGASIAALADFVARFLAAINVERVHAVGHSMGGAIASQLALAHPQRVVSLSLIASAGLGGEINSGYTEGFAKAASRRELKPVLEQLFNDASLVSRQMIDDVLKYKRLDGVEALLLELGGQLFAGGRQAEQPGLELESTGKPVLVVWGTDDKIVPAAHAANAPPGATVERFAGAGHMVQMEKASEVNRLLRQHVGA
ncbi:MAG TPA: acetoin dehydrogenase dihydrolipoyllysine-residue acetyltransferase subunit [Methylibium sp.]|nr:acetoin dehydrogenase dihydrolipoyllysine-residue acetyltransferase subunit [Methylibium sp.]